MNIQEAKEQIKEAVTIYLMKDEFGSYRIPPEKQRPVFLIGAPGIGKTAIMEQIASEMDIALVSYSMTHHTRQSALGLPFIAHREYQGQSFNVSEYTLSEIIASVYECMEKSGKKEGILFLDEINCVSETLGPSMLQFLQYKTFGNHQIPRGWVVVTAGNPPEYNRSVHEFDVVTLDRLKVMQVEPDFQVWKKYAAKRDVHKAILSYLDIRPDDFYHVENTVDGKSYVTARGWEDLSEAMTLYEEQKFPVDEALVSQYLSNDRIVADFVTYYELYRKYRSDYQIREILDGSEEASVRERAKAAGFDERITIMGLLLEAFLPEVEENVSRENCLKALLPKLRDIKAEMELTEEEAEKASSGGTRGGESLTASDSRATRRRTVSEMLTDLISEEEGEMEKKEASGSLTGRERTQYHYIISFAKKNLQQFRMERPSGNEEEFAIVQNRFQGRVDGMRESAEELSGELDNLFRFTEECFGSDNEMLMLVTELTVNDSSSAFIAEHGCDAYYRYDRKFRLYERGKDLAEQAHRIAQQKNEG